MIIYVFAGSHANEAKSLRHILDQLAGIYIILGRLVLLVDKPCNRLQPVNDGTPFVHTATTYALL